MGLQVTERSQLWPRVDSAGSQVLTIDSGDMVSHLWFMLVCWILVDSVPSYGNGLFFHRPSPRKLCHEPLRYGSPDRLPLLYSFPLPWANTRTHRSSQSLKLVAATPSASGPPFASYRKLSSNSSSRVPEASEGTSDSATSMLVSGLGLTLSICRSSSLCVTPFCLLGAPEAPGALLLSHKSTGKQSSLSLTHPTKTVGWLLLRDDKLLLAQIGMQGHP